MQKVKPNLLLQFLAIPGFLIGDFILARYYPGAVLHIYPLTWLCLILLIVLSFLPISRKPLSVDLMEKPAFGRLRWLVLIWFFEISMMILYADLIEIIKLIQPGLFNSYQHTILRMDWMWQWGLFPWAIMLSLACLIAYYAYCKHKEGSLCSLMFPVFRSGPGQTLGITANMCARLNMTLAIVSGLMMGALSLALLFCHFLHTPFVAGLNIESILSLTCILIVVSHRKLGAGLFRLFLNRHFSVFKILLIAMVLMAVLLSLMSWLLRGVQLHPVYLPLWLIKDVPLVELYELFCVVWVLAWSVVGGFYIAYVSQGYKMLDIIAAGLSLPLVVFSIEKIIGFPQFLSSTGLILGLAILACLGLFYLFTSTHVHLSLLMQTQVTADDQIKIRAYTSFVINWIRMAMGLLYLYLPGGILLLALLGVMYTLPTFIYVLVAVLASGILLFRYSEKSR